MTNIDGGWGDRPSRSDTEIMQVFGSLWHELGNGLQIMSLQIHEKWARKTKASWPTADFISCTINKDVKSFEDSRFLISPDLVWTQQWPLITTPSKTCH